MRTGARRGALGAALAASLATALLAGAPAAMTQTSGPASAGDFAGRVQIAAGRDVYLECHGSGSPTVIFEAGLRSRGDIWSWSIAGAGTGVFPRVTPFTRACVYDRPGTLAHYPYVSRSDPVPMPRTTWQDALDLHALLGAAGVPGPYVLVGASTGGLIARQFAAYYPAEVGGLVLVDAISEAMEGLMRPSRFARYNAFYLQSPSPDAAQYKDLEAIDFYSSFAAMKRKRRPPRGVPVVVISADYGFGTPIGVSHHFAALVNRTWKRSQRYLVSLRPGIRHVIASGSGHQIHVNRPGLVARWVLRVVARDRGL